MAVQAAQKKAKAGRRSGPSTRRRRSSLRGDWHVYLAECGDGTLYCGATNDIAARMKRHAAGRGARYTRGRGPIKVVYRKRMESKSAALREEARIKSLSRDEKRGLARGSKRRWEMPKWEEMQKRAQKMIEEGMKMLKSGMHEAEYLAGATAEATRLHVIVKRAQIDRYKAMHTLGEKVFAAVESEQQGEIKITDAMMKIVRTIWSLDDETRSAKASMKKLTITRKEPPPPPNP